MKEFSELGTSRVVTYYRVKKTFFVWDYEVLEGRVLEADEIHLYLEDRRFKVRLQDPGPQEAIRLGWLKEINRYTKMLEGVV
jgi:hypothetical protein